MFNGTVDGQVGSGVPQEQRHSAVKHMETGDSQNESQTRLT
jgi:hypothetical protein